MKTAKIPQNLNKLETPVSKEMDAVKYVYNWFVTNNVQSMPWRDFQKNFQQFANKYVNLWTDIRNNRPQITQEDLKAYIEGFEGDVSSDYGISYSQYNDAKHSFRDVEQLVLQINQGANAEEILAEDPAIAQYVGYVAQSSAMSGHPAAMNTVGWLRVDFVDNDWLLVDEVQTDLVNSVTQAKSIITAQSYEDFVNRLGNDEIKKQFLEKVNAQQFAMAKRNFEGAGYTLEKLEEIKQKLVALFEDWAEYAIASVIEIARRHGIKNVAIHTAESIAQRDRTVESDKIKIYYDNLAKSFGFKKQQLSTPDLKGNFWVRKVGRFKARFLNGSRY